MGLIVSALLGAFALVGAVCAKLLADEFKAWAPSIASKIVSAAVRRLPAQMRERFSEEWQSHINDVPGDLGKIVVACGFLVAAWDIAQGAFELRKRVFDVVLASLALVGLAPLLILSALAVRLDSSGPILFRQTCVGRDGKPFQIWKFRTLSVGATGISGTTVLGRFLRGTSIDELPQLFNVLLGNMSLVGPRPLYDRSVDEACGPGLVPPSAFGYPSEGEASYASNRSLMLDVKILVAAVGVVLRKKGGEGEYTAADFEADWRLGLFFTIGPILAGLIVSSIVLLLLSR